MQIPEPFDLDLTVRSHGFYALDPWRYDEARRVLGRPLRLGGGRVVYAEVAEREGPGKGLVVRVTAAGRLGAAEGAEARAQMRAALGLDEDLAPFHALARRLEPGPGRRGAPRLPDLRWAAERGAGRMLRSPTVFEDAVKTLCTTNCTWALTEAMVTNLVEALGEEGPLSTRTFPTAEAMARRPERFYRERIRAGYRAPFLRALAAAVASGRLDVEAWRRSPLDTDALGREIAALKGFGPYATEHLLRLLGRHEHLALDSWNRRKLARLRGTRRQPSDRALRRWYAPYGRFAGLAMWLEATADWHQPAREPGRGF
ncbi:MAG TPA: Fe-S cluster assembly protein HesB [Anaeromyxobacteraceae bacterium]|nr:Fe-S cluster assembly protein HesB [Anaeromyxobacteraceae bacterium]